MGKDVAFSYTFTNVSNDGCVGSFQKVLCFYWYGPFPVFEVTRETYKTTVATGATDDRHTLRERPKFSPTPDSPVTQELRK
ncbi:MAG: hypothetical protein HN868_06280 [Gammaproteobacteria bacterium]|jgi:hypothetical protein|nr:hypothetical protein [Gammaproteobacteria bacterium]